MTPNKTARCIICGNFVSVDENGYIDFNHRQIHESVNPYPGNVDAE